MENKNLEIFELGLALAKALSGDKEAIADVALLYKRHPEMFENIQDVIKTIEEVVKDPEIIMKNPQFKKDNEILAAKKLNDKKMGDVIIKNDNGTNIIFHANKKKIQEMGRLKNKAAVNGKDAQSLHNETSSHGQVVCQSILSSTPVRSSISQTDKFDTEIKSIENTLTSKSSIAQKEKALNKLEKMNNYALNAKQKLMIEKLQNQYLKKGVSK